MRAVPRRHRSPGGGPASTRRRPHHRDDGRRARLARGRRGGHARRVDLRPRDRPPPARCNRRSAPSACSARKRARERRPARHAAHPDRRRDRRSHRAGARGRDDPRRLPSRGHRHPDDVLRGEPHPDQRLPRLRRGGRGVARARAGLLASGRSGHEDLDRHGTRPALAHARVRVPGLLGRHVAGEPRLAPVAGRVRRAPRALRRRDGADGGGGARRADARAPSRRPTRRPPRRSRSR